MRERVGRNGEKGIREQKRREREFKEKQDWGI